MFRQKIDHKHLVTEWLPWWPNKTYSTWYVTMVPVKFSIQLGYDNQIFAWANLQSLIKINWIVSDQGSHYWIIHDI